MAGKPQGLRPAVRRKAVLTERLFEGAHGLIDFLIVNREDSAKRIVWGVEIVRAAESAGGAGKVGHKLVAGVLELILEFGDRALGDGSGRQAPVVNRFRVAPDRAAQVF